MTTRRISIDPLTRLEGHGRIDLFLDDDGEVQDCRVVVPELRGFERFVVGRPIEELPRIVARICGICPACHHLAGAKAVDACLGRTVPPTAVKLRDMYYQAQFLQSHIAHFYALAAPDFLCGPDTVGEDGAALTRDLLGVVARLGETRGRAVVEARAKALEVQRIIGGPSFHPVWCLPGGVSRGVTPADVARLASLAGELYEFAQLSLQVLRDLVLGNPAHLATMVSNDYTLPLASLGLVDDAGHVTFYEGTLRLVDVHGGELARFEAKDYARVIAEHVEPWTYLKFPYLRARGWKGLFSGPESSLFTAGPLARLNVASGMATPRAQEAYEEFCATLGKPCHAALAAHWARLIEMLQNAETLQRYAADPELTGNDVLTFEGEPTGEGIGVVEAMRGTLVHHYTCDANGICTGANIIVGTTHNNAAIQLLTRRAAEAAIGAGRPPGDAALNRIEMAFRAYDPCFSCATHSLPGQLPLELRVHRGGTLESVVRRSGTT